MGFNYRLAGYTDVGAMVDAFMDSIEAQIVGMFTFIENTPDAIGGLREGNTYRFAEAYNGPGKASAYEKDLNNAAAAFRSL